MDFSKSKWGHYGWFLGGFLIGLTLISLGHAALPKKASPGSGEMRSLKQANPELDEEVSRLASLESRYAESKTQQQRLKSATMRASNGQVRTLSRKKAVQ
jgi:hypothetical protein